MYLTQYCMTYQLDDKIYSKTYFSAFLHCFDWYWQDDLGKVKGDNNFCYQGWFHPAPIMRPLFPFLKRKAGSWGSYQVFLAQCSGTPTPPPTTPCVEIFNLDFHSGSKSLLMVGIRWPFKAESQVKVKHCVKKVLWRVARNPEIQLERWIQVARRGKTKPHSWLGFGLGLVNKQSRNNWNWIYFPCFLFPASSLCLSKEQS